MPNRVKPTKEQIQWFAGEMEIVLRQNDHKRRIAPYLLFKKLVEEVFELDRIMHTANTKYMSCVPQPIAKQVIKEAVDVANYALMIATAYHKALGGK